MTRRSRHPRSSGRPPAPEGAQGAPPRARTDAHQPALHRHEHVHDEEGAHRHPHHHDAVAHRAEAHQHAHTLRFERYTYLVSPIHDLDPRFKVCASALLILGAVAGHPLRPAEFALLALMLASLTLLARVPLGWMLSRSAVVLPIALGIAAFAPLGRTEALTWARVAEAYAENWVLIWSIASKAWVSAYTVLLLSATTPLPRLFKGLAALRTPEVFLTLLTFLYRFTDVFGEQLRSMRRAVAGRAPSLRGLALLRLYGALAGNLFVRAYERGERIYAAMVSRGYTGVLPTADSLVARPADWLLLGTAAITAAALLLY